MNRRDALRLMLSGTVAGCTAGLSACRRSAEAVVESAPALVAPEPELRLAARGTGSVEQWVRPALHYEKREKKRVVCRLCPRECLVGDRERGFCGSRENRGGSYYTLVYGQAAAANIDPIEKKPFFHFLPGTRAFSIAAAGCNMDCRACQNWEISQARPEQITDARSLPPAQVASGAKQSGCRSIAYTYSEPTVFYEYMLDTAKAGHGQGIRSVMVSGGYISPAPLRQLLPHLDAVKIDLKSFREETYVDYCRSHLQPVLDTIKVVSGAGKWLEVVYLVVPTVNDSATEVRDMSRWLLKVAGPGVALHFSRFFPAYQLTNLPPTPLATLERCYGTARAAGLQYVYVGNITDPRRASTVCPGCGQVVVRRDGIRLIENRLRSGTCPKCKHRIPGVWG